MEEQLISFETAKLAKEKGFDAPVLEFYDYEGIITKNTYDSNGYDYNQIAYSKQIGHDSTYNTSAPTQSLLQKWLRDTHKINCYNMPNDFDRNHWHCKVNSNTRDFYVKHSDSYEEALEFGLLEALKLI